MAYPNSIDAPGGTAAQGTSLLAVIDHSLDHRTLGSAVVALENKVGLGLGSAGANQLFIGSGAGTSGWNQQWNNGTIGTASFIGGTVSSAVIGTNNLLSFNAPQGYLINGELSISVGSNNLTVAIKTLAGSDPSATNPVYCRIGNTIQTLTAALSVTKNAGTNWFGSGATELATFEIDYFVYLGFNATDGITIGFARFPYALTYGDFNATSTNEKYAAISTITHATSTDNYELIGRFNAILSATASFNWSLPGTSVIVNRPIYETRSLSYQPTYGGSGSLTYLTVTTTLARYIINRNQMYVKVVTTGTTGGTASTYVTFTLPISMANVDTTYLPIGSGFSNEGPNPKTGLVVYQAANKIGVGKYDASNAGLGAGNAWGFAIVTEI